MTDTQWWPVDDVRITAEFGDSPEWYRQNVGQLGHNAIDIGGAWGTPLYAIDDGVVVQEGWNIPWSGVAGGIAMMVKSSWGYWGLAHCSATHISVGDTVARGQHVGAMGNTGLVTGVHVHAETLPLAPNFGNGYSGRVNPRALINLQPRGTTAGTTPGGDTVIHYHREDTKARASGRSIKPGEYIYLDTRENPDPSNATNCVGGVGNYSITPHVYAAGTPGDEIELALIWQKGEGEQSHHYVESAVIGPQGIVNRSAEFKRAVPSGYSVWVRAKAKPSNRGDVKITLLDCDAFLYA